MNFNELNDLFARVEASVKKQAAMRAKRKAHFESANPIPQICLVAWIDLLGFREQLRNADTDEKFLEVYRRMLAVHREFEKDTASIEPEQAELNNAQGKRIIALSDGLVIAVNLDSENPMREVSSLYEIIGSFMESLRLAQACCASVGNFLRGGIALGRFWFNDDILLSPALVEAYEYETKKAVHPVIIMEKELVEGLRARTPKEGFREDLDPMANLFRECEWMSGGDEGKFMMLNFMPAFDFDEDGEVYLRRYHGHLVKAHSAAPACAKAKYEFLMRYAAEYVANEHPELQDLFESAQATEGAE